MINRRLILLVKHILVFGALLMGLPVHAQSFTVPQWEVIDIPIVVDTDIQKPFTVDANALFEHVSGEKITVPIFYDGDNRWLVRFSSSRQGLWRYQTQSDIPGLSGGKGEVKVTKPSVDNHGGIVIREDAPQHFYYEDGTPYFLLAFELDWLYALDYHNERGLPKSEHLLSLLKQNGINQIVMNVYSYDVKWPKDPLLQQHPEHEFGAPDDIFPFLGSNEEPDFSSLNVAFFKKFDRTIQLLHDKRISAHVMIYVWNKLVNWPEMNSEADNMYFDYVAKRYGAYPNIVWDISKEALFYGRADEQYINERIDRLRKLNPFDRLITVHDYGFCNRNPEQVDFISSQDWKWNIYDQMLNVKKRYQDKPVFNIEHGGYEKSPYTVFPGDYIDPEYVYRRNWEILFAGVYSTYYWQGAAWNVIIYNPFEQSESFEKPKFEYYKQLTKFFHDYPYHQFEPAPAKNASGYTLHRKSDGTYLIYVTKEHYQIVGANWVLNPKKGAKKRVYKWFNTLTGEYSAESKVTKGAVYRSPWAGEADSILISEVVE